MLLGDVPSLSEAAMVSRKISVDTSCSSTEYVNEASENSGALSLTSFRVTSIVASPYMMKIA